MLGEIQVVPTKPFRTNMNSMGKENYYIVVTNDQSQLLPIYVPISVNLKTGQLERKQI